MITCFWLRGNTIRTDDRFIWFDLNLIWYFHKVKLTWHVLILNNLQFNWNRLKTKIQIDLTQLNPIWFVILKVKLISSQPNLIRTRPITISTSIRLCLKRGSLYFIRITLVGIQINNLTSIYLLIELFLKKIKGGFVLKL
jgi:hypothetical protein